MLIKPDNRTTLTHNTIEHGKQNQLFSSLNKRGERCEVFTHYLSILLCSLQAVAQSLPRVAPEQVGMDSHRLLHADEAIHRAIDHKEIPGAVLAVIRHGKMAYLKAYGNKRIYPNVEPMEINTVFDMASCSKSMSTAVSVMILVERGQLRLLDRVSFYLPDFQEWRGENGEKKDIRIIDLMTHTSGLPPYAPVSELQEKYGSPNPKGLMEYISTCKREFKPQTKFQYSCLNYITLQHIIETITGQSLRDFAKKISSIYWECNTRIICPPYNSRTESGSIRWPVPGWTGLHLPKNKKTETYSAGKYTIHWHVS